MEVQFGPNAVEEPNILYKLQRKIKVFNTNDLLTNRGYNLIACASNYGIVIVASPDATLSVYYLKDLIEKDSEPKNLSIKLAEKPTHIAVSCDGELLAVTGGRQLEIYKISNLQNQTTPSLTINCDVNSSFVSALQWNPCITDTIAIAYFNGCLLVAQASNGQVKKVQSKARCICWSPKGKQIVVGNSDGTLCQFKPDLSPMKSFPAPNLFEGAPAEVVSIYWISTFQFAVVYRNAADNSRPAVTIVNTPKTGAHYCLNHEDICYSMGSNRPWYYYLLGLPQWNMILSSSSNSMEIATLGSADGSNWLQWCQSDEARPELPLTDSKQENYPVGICLDCCAIHQIPWGENEILPYMPLLLVVSQTGLLSIFNVINLNKQAPVICAPPKPIALPTQLMTTNIPGEAPIVTQPAPAPAQAPVIPQNTAFVAPQQSAPIGQPPAYTAPITASVAQPIQPPPQLPVKAIQMPQSAPTSQFAKPFVAPTPAFAAAQPQNVSQSNTKTAPTFEKPTPAVETPPPQATEKVTKQAQEINAALKAEQEKMNQIKVNNELKNMLVKEVNDFQMELYKFIKKSNESHAKLQQDINSLQPITLQSMKKDQLHKESLLDELRSAIIQLKLDLVRGCAVVAETRTYSETKDLEDWAQADPLTTKRVAEIKKISYYVQNQLDQAYKGLDHKWNEYAARKDNHFKPGERMIRPILDDVYQPLVKQQEILSRQQAVLKTLNKALNEFDKTPMFKSTSLLRSSPFRNKDPLSKLTKNILNMSIDNDTNRQNEALLSAPKLDALRDMLSNHKTVKIKPVNVELRQHLHAMKLNYEKCLKEKYENDQKLIAKNNAPVKKESTSELVPVQSNQSTELVPKIKKSEPKPEVLTQSPISVPQFTTASMKLKPTAQPPVNVVRTLFADDPPVQSKPQKPVTTEPSLSAMQLSSQATTTASPRIYAKSVLKDLLQQKAANAEAKNDANTFMGQTICSPNTFVSSTSDSGKTDTTSKPLPAMFIKNVTPISTEPKTEVKTPSKPAEEKPMTNLFGMKTSTPLPNVFGNASETPKPLAFSFSKLETPKTKVVDKIAEKLKENVIQDAKLAEDSVEDKKDNVAKPNIQIVKKTDLAQQTAVNVPPSNEEAKPVIPVVKTEPADLSVTKSPSSIFAAANTSPSLETKPSSIFGTPTNQTDTKEPPKSPSASSIFGTAVAAQPSGFGAKASPGSIFASTPSTTPSSFGSIFGTATTTQSSVFAPSTQSTTQPSVFSSPPPANSVFSATPPSTPTTNPTNLFASNTSVFGAQTSTASIFSATPPSSSATTSIFGGTSAPTAFATSTSNSIFGTATTTTQSTAPTSFPSVFGAASNQTAKQSPVLGFPSNSAPTSAFGNPVQSTAQAASNNAATTQSSLFGGAEANLFASASISTTSASSPNSGGNIFGGSSGSVFGGTASTFGQANKSPASIFGSASSAFGQTPTNNIWGNNNASSGGGFGSVFAQQPATTQASSTFGTGSFSGNASPGQAFGAAPQAAPPLFGNPQQQNSGSVFGGGSVFGSKPAFGQAAGFGSPTANANSGFGSFGGFNKSPNSGFGSQATFGGGASFGSAAFGGNVSPGKAFGGNSPQGFSPQQSQPNAFENLATQETVSFGNLAQTNQQPKPSAFNTSPSFTGWRS